MSKKKRSEFHFRIFRQDKCEAQAFFRIFRCKKELSRQKLVLLQAKNEQAMKASIINIGDELLIGQVVNTNATYMSRALTAAGIAVAEVCTRRHE